MNELAGFPDLPVLDELGARLGTAFAASERDGRSRPRARLAWRWRPLLAAGVAFALLAASAAAATLLVLRGSVIPAPQKVDLQPPMIVKPDTVRLTGVTAADPVDRRTWTVRVARSETGLMCLTVGELRSGRFGITGLDGRFRTLAPGFTDGCGSHYIGARVFDSDSRQAVRTVVDGYGGPTLRAVLLESSAGTRHLRVSKDGFFVGALAGYPEDIGIRAKLIYAGGRTETHSFGHSPFVRPDAQGATRLEGFQVSNLPQLGCVRVLGAREVKPFFSAPVACGDIRGAFYFRAVTLPTGSHGGRGITTWSWQHPSRTLVYGSVRARLVKSVTLLGAGRAIRIKPAAGGGFQRLFPASVNASKLTLVVTRRDGRVERATGQAHLLPPPGARR